MERLTLYVKDRHLVYADMEPEQVLEFLRLWCDVKVGAKADQVVSVAASLKRYEEVDAGTRLVDKTEITYVAYSDIVAVQYLSDDKIEG